MRICYVDEAGCTGALPSAASDIQPVFILCGVDLPHAGITDFTRSFLELKRRFFPALARSGAKPLEWLLAEVKGADLRRQAVAEGRRRSRHAIGFLDHLVTLLEDHGARLYGRVWVKGIGVPFDGRAVYTSSLQYIFTWFHRGLAEEADTGFVVCDSRNRGLNSVVSFSIFTQKFRQAGDPYPRVYEMPVFGHSENHAGVQVADLVCSALLFPLAVHAYCLGRLSGVHARDYSALHERFGPRLAALQVRRPDPESARGRRVGGIMVDDRLAFRPRAAMFPEEEPAPLTATG